MNLHEDCLLKYLLNPMSLINSTELLKLNNDILSKGLTQKNKKTLKINYSAK